jgi:hypothetical protein
MQKDRLWRSSLRCQPTLREWLLQTCICAAVHNSAGQIQTVPDYSTLCPYAGPTCKSMCSCLKHMVNSMQKVPPRLINASATVRFSNILPYHPAAAMLCLIPHKTTKPQWRAGAAAACLNSQGPRVRQAAACCWQQGAVPDRCRVNLCLLQPVTRAPRTAVR